MAVIRGGGAKVNKTTETKTNKSVLSRWLSMQWRSNISSNWENEIQNAATANGITIGGGGAVVDILILFGPCQFLGSYFRLFLFCYLLGLSIGSRVCTCQCICEDCVGQSRSISICWPLTLVELDGKTKPEKKEKKRGRELCVIQQMGKKKIKKSFCWCAPFCTILFLNDLHKK